VPPTGSEKHPRDAKPRIAEAVAVEVRMSEASEAVGRTSVDAAALVGVDREVDEPWSEIERLVAIEEITGLEEAGSRAGSSEILYMESLEDPPHWVIRQ